MNTFHKVYKSTKIWALLAIALVLPLVLSNKYYLHVANLAMMFAIVTLSLNILASSGLMNVGYVAFYGIGAYASAILTTRFGFPILAGLLAAGIFSSIGSLFLALPTMRLKGMYFAVASLAFGEIIYQVFANWTSVTEGTKGIKGIPAPEWFGLNFRDYAVYYFLCLAVLIMVIILTRNLMHSRIGRAIFSIRQNDIAAEAMGINIARYKTIAFMTSAFFAGVAGALYAHEVRYVSPDTFASAESAAILAMLVVGGIGSIPGSILGGIVLTVLPEMLRSFGNIRLVIYGAAVVVIIIFAPKGLGGLIEYVDDVLSGKRRIRAVHKREKKVEGE